MNTVFDRVTVDQFIELAEKYSVTILGVRSLPLRFLRILLEELKGEK